MIVWLASYPRSGNTLLRTVLRQTLGLHSLPERSDWPRFLQTKTAPSENARVYGHIHPWMPWDEFYPMATASRDLHLVKTHEAPIDDQPAIYVVRNGRKAIYSYLKYHRSYLPDLGRSLIEILTGYDYYGDWTTHYRAWNEEMAPARRLLLRYEELCQATPSLLRRVADFLGHQSGPEPLAWENPFASLHEREPDFFREGRTEWDWPEEWSREVEWLFSVFHGRLMAELDYDSSGPENADASWEDWHERAAQTALNLVDSSSTMEQSLRRAESETALLRTRLLL